MTHGKPTAADSMPSLSPLPRLLMTANQAAEALAISPRKLWELTNRREIPVVRIGKLLRYSPETLREWIANQQTTQT